MKWGSGIRPVTWPDLLAFLTRWLPAPPARVLEVGCGDGSLTVELRERGHRAIGIDPEPPAGDGFIASTLESFRADEPFDAAVAIRSLHHVGDLSAAVDRLHAALRPAGRLVMFEFAVENVDDAARTWQAAAGLAEMHTHVAEAPTHGAEAHTHGAHDVIALGDLRAVLRRRFRELAFEPAPYLAREADREDLLEREREAIATGELRPTGARMALEALG